MIGNAFSNFYEKFIYRGALLAILMKYVGNKSVAVTASALVFCQESIWPAWLSHCVMDFVADSIFHGV